MGLSPELKRHLPDKSHYSTSKNYDPFARITPRSIKISMAGSILLGLAFYSLPYFFTVSFDEGNSVKGNLTDRKEALNNSSIRRGPFLNSGSRDAGKDPNWNKGAYDYSKLKTDTDLGLVDRVFMSLANPFGTRSAEKPKKVKKKKLKKSDSNK
uniref:Uncharacterized protein n=1 Tax=Proboscia inermis TaxID=420281 RepID=A0A6T8FEN6_9STRA|mmetsp:Transcript_12238/g.12302  ORF Transcript_12238/g.12302 Transcript_12238/m.12302 type:complete len:154 (+) Transcript_12238:48-509(+)